MNRSKLHLSILILSLAAAVNSQEPSKPYLVDEFENVFCSDPLRSRLDAFFVEVTKQPGLKGVVVTVRDRSMPGRSARYVDAIRNHIVYRNLDPALIRFSEMGVGHSTHFQFWIVPGGAPFPKGDTSSIESRITRTTFWDSSQIQSVKNGKVEFGEDRTEPCDWGLDLGHFAAAVHANKNATAYLLSSATNRRDVAKAKLALLITVRKLSASHRLSARQIRTIYSGIRGELAMQLWMVPKGGAAPKYKKGTLP